MDCIQIARDLCAEADAMVDTLATCRSGEERECRIFVVNHLTEAAGHLERAERWRAIADTRREEAERG